MHTRLKRLNNDFLKRLAAAPNFRLKSRLKVDRERELHAPSDSFGIGPRTLLAVKITPSTRAALRNIALNTEWLPIGSMVRSATL